MGEVPPSRNHPINSSSIRMHDASRTNMLQEDWLNGGFVCSVDFVYDDSVGSFFTENQQLYPFKRLLLGHKIHLLHSQRDIPTSIFTPPSGKSLNKNGLLVLNAKNEISSRGLPVWNAFHLKIEERNPIKTGQCTLQSTFTKN